LGGAGGGGRHRRTGGFLIESGQGLRGVARGGLGGENQVHAGGVPELLEGGMATVHAHRLQAAADDFQVGFRGGDDGIVVDGVDQFFGDVFGLAGGFLFYRLFVGIENVGLGGGEFGGGEAMLEGAPEFLFQHRHRILPMVVTDDHLHAADLGKVEDLIAGCRAAGNRRIFLLREAFKAPADHRVGHLQWQLRDAVGGGVRLFLIGTHQVEREGGGGHFLVGENRGRQPLGCFDLTQIGVGAGGHGVDHRGEGGFYPLDHRRGFHIADHDEGHARRRVVAGVKIREAFAWGGLDDILNADGETLGNERIRQQLAELLYHESVAYRVAAGFFGQDDAPFVIDFLGLQQGAVAEIAQDGEAEFQCLFGNIRQIEHIHGLVKRGAGIDVSAKGDAEVLQAGDEFFG